MRQAMTQVLSSSAVCLSGFLPLSHLNEHRLARAAKAVTTAYRSEKQHWQYVLLREISRSRAISVETTTDLTLKQVGKHVWTNSGAVKIESVKPKQQHWP